MVVAHKKLVTAVAAILQMHKKSFRQRLRSDRGQRSVLHLCMVLWGRGHRRKGAGFQRVSAFLFYIVQFLPNSPVAGLHGLPHLVRWQRAFEGVTCAQDMQRVGGSGGGESRAAHGVGPSFLSVCRV